MKKQVHAYYTGRVQGVGFRFTVREVAKEAGIAGWVKNLADGSVEILAEAQEEVLSNFLQNIEQSFSSRIQSVNKDWLPARGAYKEFVIVF